MNRPSEVRELIETLNRRCRQEFDRAERLQAELDHVRGSRLWPIFAWLRRVRGWLGRSSGNVDADPNNGQAGGRADGALLDECRVPPAGRVSIIIPFRDRLGLLRNCLRSIAASTYRQFEIILVDHGSAEPRMRRYLDRLAKRRRFRVVRDDGDFNFARLCNLGARQARGDWLLFLNNDTEALTTDWLERLLELAGHPRIGIVGATLLYPNGTIQHTGIFPIAAWQWQHRYEHQPGAATGDHGELAHIRSVPAVTGACLVIGRRLFAEIGGFDEHFATDNNDVDLCCRVRARGLEVAVTPHARLHHFTGLSRGFSRAAPYRAARHV